jgi:hypothetical protein
MSNIESRQGSPLDDNSADAAFVKRIAEPLQAPETLDDTFEARLLEGLREDVVKPTPDLRGSRSWWTRKRTVALSPLAGLAIAAGLAAVTVVGTLSMTGFRSRPAHSVAAANHGAVVHLVRFVFVDSSARAVALVGDFNGWNPALDDLQPTGSHGAWSISIPLTPGRHEYAFVVDGKRWAPDQFASSVHDDFGTVTSVIQLASDRSPNAT